MLCALLRILLLLHVVCGHAIRHGWLSPAGRALVAGLEQSDDRLFDAQSEYEPASISHDSHEPALLSHAKRQPFGPGVIWRNMLAVIYFTCPEGGSKHRTFRWQARYNQEKQLINLYGLDGIDYFDKITVVLYDFESFLHHSYCKALYVFPYSICFYQIKLQIYGRVNQDSISMGITTWSSVQENRPSVREVCVYTARPAPKNTSSSTCGAGRAKPVKDKPVFAAACDVTDVRVYMIPN